MRAARGFGDFYGPTASRHFARQTRGCGLTRQPSDAQRTLSTDADARGAHADAARADGTGVRDYIHVMDLAEGHLAALAHLQNQSGWQAYNLGTGQGYSVLDMVRAFEEASGKPVPYRISPRRPGDIATCYSDPSKAERELGWKAERGLPEMMRDAWRWQKMNPNGYR